MKIGVNLKVDVSKLDKSKFFHAKSGAIYADLTVFIDPSEADQYGYHGGITQSLSKEERAAKVKSTYVGNAKVFWQDQQEHLPKQNETVMFAGDVPKDSIDTDIPF